MGEMKMSNKISFFGKLFNKAENKSETARDEELFTNKEIIIRSPIKGSIIPLSEVKDEVFSQGIMGKGVAIMPGDGKVFSPVTGRISSVFPTKHAVGIVDSSNVEVLIHVGMDTVQLNGKYYKSHIKEGDIVNAGELILEFDMDKIKAAGYEVVTPVVITNTQDFSDIIVTDAVIVDVKDKLLTVIRF